MARFLLVDDDHDIREFGVALLASAGHEAFSADGALSALDFLQRNPIDVLITDANMPQHSGFDLLKTLSQDPRYSLLSVVMLTGRRERRDIEKALGLGVHDYIVKPIDPMLFLKKISDLLERRPPEERPEVDFAALKLNSAAVATVNVEIVSVSELGLTLRSPNPFREGSRITLTSDVFSSIGIEAPFLKVISSVEQETGERLFSFESKIAFVGTDERTLMKIRAWVHANTVRNAARAGKAKKLKAA